MSGEGRENLIAEARPWVGALRATHNPHAADLIERLVAALESSRPRLIETVEELDALPERSIVLDRDGDVWQSRGVWWCSYETVSVGSPRLLKKHGPLLLVFEPGKEQS